MNTVQVWDKEGVMHKMSTLNANDVVQHLGWTRHAPRVAKEVLEAEEPAPAGKKKGGKAKAAEVPKEEPPAAKTIEELEEMERDALAAYAKENFGMDFDESVSAEDIISAILAEA